MFASNYLQFFLKMVWFISVDVKRNHPSMDFHNRRCRLRQENAIAVLHFNKIRLTVNCLESILAAGYPPHLVYCFDNGSDPDVFQQISTAFPLYNHRRCDENHGFSGGFNRALEWIFSEGFESVLFCTNDTLVEPGALGKCAETAENTGAGMVAPLITFASNYSHIDSSGAFFQPSDGTLHHYHDLSLPTLLDPSKDYIPGTAIWISKHAFRELGGIDESFHMYWEDADLCFRAHQKGIILARCYNASIRHGGGQTCRKKPLYTTFYFQRNRIRFCKRYLKNEEREGVLQSIHSELTSLKNQWEQNNDTQRLGFFTLLMEELEN